jgi:hypothetical protein
MYPSDCRQSWICFNVTHLPLRASSKARSIAFTFGFISEKRKSTPNAPLPPNERNTRGCEVLVLQAPFVPVKWGA